MIVKSVFAAALLILFQAMPAHAQALRTWVSGVGDDINPCARTSPCKTFAGAISKTAAGGQISVLDPGGFGAVTITKSMSIVAASDEGSILATGSNGIIVNAGPNDVVSLYGLFLEGGGSGLNGIRFLAGRRLEIRNCLIRGFQGGTGIGIDIQVPGPGNVLISDTTVTKNTAGILVRANGAQNVIAFLDRVQVHGNANAGLTADGARALLRMSNSTVVDNGIGLSILNGGRLASFGNNVILNNGVDGAPTAVQELK
jgi:hypothetical protein